MSGLLHQSLPPLIPLRSVALSTTPTSVPPSVMTMGWSVVVDKSMSPLKSTSCAALGARIRVLARTRPVLPDSLHDGMGEDQFERGDAFHEVPHVIVDRLVTISSGVPICTIRPSFMIAIRLPMRIASSRSWVMKTVVLFNSADSVMNCSCSRRRIRGSSAENGSSINRISGSDAEPGEPDPLLHAARQLARKAILVAVEIDEVEAALGDLPALRFGLALHL